MLLYSHDDDGDDDGNERNVNHSLLFSLLAHSQE